MTRKYNKQNYSDDKTSTFIWFLSSHSTRLKTGSSANRPIHSTQVFENWSFQMKTLTFIQVVSSRSTWSAKTGPGRPIIHSPLLSRMHLECSHNWMKAFKQYYWSKISSTLSEDLSTMKVLWSNHCLWILELLPDFRNASQLEHFLPATSVLKFADWIKILWSVFATLKGKLWPLCKSVSYVHGDLALWDSYSYSENEGRGSLGNETQQTVGFNQDLGYYSYSANEALRGLGRHNGTEFNEDLVALPPTFPPTVLKP